MMELNLIENAMDVGPTQADIDYSEMLKFKQLMQNSRDLTEVTKDIVALAEDKHIDAELRGELTGIAKKLTVAMLERHMLSKQYVKIFGDVLPRKLASSEELKGLSSGELVNEML